MCYDLLLPYRSYNSTICILVRELRAQIDAFSIVSYKTTADFFKSQGENIRSSCGIEGNKHGMTQIWQEKEPANQAPRR